jgi:hypothetical protein
VRVRELEQVLVPVPARELELEQVLVPAREPVLARELAQVPVLAQEAEHPAKALAALRRCRYCSRSTASTWRRQIRGPSARPMACRD